MSSSNPPSSTVVLCRYIPTLIPSLYPHVQTPPGAHWLQHSPSSRACVALKKDGLGGQESTRTQACGMNPASPVLPLRAHKGGSAVSVQSGAPFGGRSLMTSDGDGKRYGLSCLVETVAEHGTSSFRLRYKFYLRRAALLSHPRGAIDRQQTNLDPTIIIPDDGTFHPSFNCPSSLCVGRMCALPLWLVCGKGWMIQGRDRRRYEPSRYPSYFFHPHHHAIHCSAASAGF